MNEGSTFTQGQVTFTPSAVCYLSVLNTEPVKLIWFILSEESTNEYSHEVYREC